ncbi:hypothetical protein C8Q76DRAFT_624757 [Earliella scabrosa]|nr:hypothetical protein C8Q76DRAFT_624757 [Earliella scabrosa]
MTLNRAQVPPRPPGCLRPLVRGISTTRSQLCGCSPSFYDPAYVKLALGGAHWHAEESMQTVVVLGDSYSKSYEGTTWVDHLEKRLLRQGKQTTIHNFASPGATAQDDLSTQLSAFFARFSKKGSPNESPRLSSDKTTYFVSMGINDCGSTDADELEPIVESVFDTVHDLYVKAGARNLILVDVPPIDRSPQATDSGMSDEIEERVKTWNELLHTQATEFGTSSTEATVLLFSSHQVLSEVLDDPAEFDFGEDDPTTEGGGIWADDLHLTADVHDVLAERLLSSVTSMRPSA